MAPYPITISGLIDQVREADRYVEYRTALLNIRRRLIALPRKAPSPNAPARLYGKAPKPAMLPGVVLALRLVDQLVEDIDQLPLLITIMDTAPRPAADPVFVPDPLGLVVVDAGTGRPVADPPSLVPWWPRLSSAAKAAGLVDFADVADEELELDYPCELFAGRVEWRSAGRGLVLVEWARARQAIAGAAAGYRRAFERMPRGGSIKRRSARDSVRATGRVYAAHLEFVDRLGDVLAARFGAYLSSITAQVETALAIQGIDMPVSTATPAVVTNLATRIRDAITAGHGGRLTVNDSETAFSWAPGLPTSLLTYLAPETVEGRRTTVTTAKNSGTPVVPVPEGGQKPNVVSFDSDEVNLVKYPGQAEISVESAQFVRGIEPAITNVIGGQIVRAIEADAVTAMRAAAGVTVTGAADITAGVLAAIAQLRAGGAAPNAVALSVNDWVAVMQATGAAGYLNFSSAEAGPVGTWLGLAPCIVPSLTDGNAVVVDGRSAPVGEPAGGPLCLVDPFTKAGTNKIVITIESWAVAMVTSPGGVATVAVTAGP